MIGPADQRPEDSRNSWASPTRRPDTSRDRSRRASSTPRRSPLARILRPASTAPLTCPFAGTGRHSYSRGFAVLWFYGLLLLQKPIPPPHLLQHHPASKEAQMSTDDKARRAIAWRPCQSSPSASRRSTETRAFVWRLGSVAVRIAGRFGCGHARTSRCVCSRMIGLRAWPRASTAATRRITASTRAECCSYGPLAQMRSSCRSPAAGTCTVATGRCAFSTPVGLAR